MHPACTRPLQSLWGISMLVYFADYIMCYAIVPCSLCSAGDVVKSCTVGMAPDGESGTVLVDTVLV